MADTMVDAVQDASDRQLSAVERHIENLPEKADPTDPDSYEGPTQLREQLAGYAAGELSATGAVLPDDEQKSSSSRSTSKSSSSSKDESVQDKVSKARP